MFKKNTNFRNLFAPQVCLIRKFVVTLWCQIKQAITMRKRKEKIKLTEKEVTVEQRLLLCRLSRMFVQQTTLEDISSPSREERRFDCCPG